MASEQAGSDESEATSRETRWIVQWSEPFGESEPKRIVDTKAEAEAVIEAMKETYEPVEDEPHTFRVELGAEVLLTKREVPYGPLSDGEWDPERDA